MLNKLGLYFRNFDWLILTSVILLIAFSLVEIYSVALGQDNFSSSNFQKQLAFAGIGLFLLFLFAFIDSHFLKSSSRYIYVLAIIILVMVLIFGSVNRGTKGWFNIFGFGRNFQVHIVGNKFYYCEKIIIIIKL